MVVRPFRFYSERELADIETGVAEILQAWTKHWFPAPRMRFDLRNVEGREDPLESAVTTTVDPANPGHGVYSERVVVLATTAAPLAAALLGVPADRGATQAAAAETGTMASLPRDGHDEKIVNSMLRSCLSDLAARIGGDGAARSVTLAAADPGKLGLAARLVRGSGSVAVELRCDGFGLQLLVAQSALEAWLAPISVKRLGGVSPLLQGVVDRSVALQAELGRTQLTIGELRELTTGDVLRLDQSIETAPVLMTDSGAEVARGRLGSRDAHRALQLF